MQQNRCARVFLSLFLSCMALQFVCSSNMCLLVLVLQAHALKLGYVWLTSIHELVELSRIRDTESFDR